MSSASTMREEKKTKKEMVQGHVRVRREASKMESLPFELVMDILSMVPTVELGNLRCVCKRWRNIVKVRNPHFRTLHMSHSMSRPTENNLLLLKGKSDDLHFVDLASRRGKTIKTLNVPFLAQYEIIGSCNGLLCLGSKERWDIVVVNPFTRQYVRWDIDFSGDVLSWGFGFDSVNKIYKVVVIVWDELYEESYFRTCDLDSRRWSSDWDMELEDTFDFILTSRSPACFVNGRLHWTYNNHDSVMIVSYDLADGEFRSVPTPDCLCNRRKLDLFVMKGCLCISRSRPPISPRLEIWVMKDYGVKESWVKPVDTMPRMPKSLPSHFDENHKWMWRLTLKGLGSIRDGEVLLTCKRRESEEAVLFSSGPTCKKLQFLELERMGYQVGSVINTASLNWIK